MSLPRFLRRRPAAPSPAVSQWLPGVPLHALHANCAVVGMTGSGKSVLLAKLLRRQLRLGGLYYPAAKPDDGCKIKRMIAEAGRTDVVWLSPGGCPHSLNPFPPAGGDPDDLSVIDAGLVEAVGAAVMRLDGAQGAADGGTWKSGGTQCVRAAAGLVRHSGRRPTFDLLRRVVLSAAPDPAALTAEQYRAGLNHRLGGEAFARNRPGVMRVLEYWAQEYPGIPPRQRQGYLGQFLPALDLLTTGSVGRLFNGEPTVELPDVIERGRVLVVDYPPGTTLALGVAVGAAVRYAVQRAALARVVTPRSRTFLSVVDEYPLTASEFDATVFAVARSAKCPTVIALQGRESLLSVFPGQHGEALADVILSNCSLRLFTRPTPPTAQWISSTVLGQRLGVTVSGQSQAGDYSGAGMLYGDPKAMSAGFSQQLVPWVQPHELANMRTGSDRDGAVVDFLRTPGDAGRPFAKGSVRRGD